PSSPAAAYRAAMARGQWLSSDPGKAAAERFYLLYSPIWIAFVGVVMLTGMYRSWSDTGFMLFGLGVAAPLVLVPYLLPLPEVAGHQAWSMTLFRFNLWIAILVFFGCYVSTHFCSDFLVMR